MSPEAVVLRMAQLGERVFPESIGFYDSLNALAEKVRGSKNWEQGETFVYAESEHRYLILCQVAPSSCEMMVASNKGFHDIVTAYRYGQDELTSQLKGYLGDPVAKKAIPRMGM